MAYFFIRKKIRFTKFKLRFQTCSICIFFNKYITLRKCQTSYVTVPPEVDGCRSVTVETAPLADKIHTALGPC